MAEYLVRVEGHVQGVGYRAFAQREAVVFGLTGFVRNLADGRVEILAQGDKDILDRFVERLREGPRMAAVHNVVLFDRVESVDHGSFEVR